MNLSSLDDNHRELIKWLCCNELIELASAFLGGQITLYSLGNPMDECPDTPRDKAAWDFVQTNGFDCDARGRDGLRCGGLHRSSGAAI